MALITAKTPVVSAKARTMMSPVFSQKMVEIITPVMAVKTRYSPPATAGGNAGGQETQAEDAGQPEANN